MSLLDMVRGALSGAGGDSPAARLAAQALQMLQDNEHGGLAGMLQQFSQAGLGDAVKSWVGTGANLPISAEDLQRVLGSGKLQDLAAQAGISHEAAAGDLARILPQIVDHLTPGGQLPQGSALDQAFSMLRGKLGG